MTILTFQTPDEARAWDMYVAQVIASEITKGEIVNLLFVTSFADDVLLERRKRMAPEKVEI